MDYFGRTVSGAFIGAIITALSLLGLGLADDYFNNHNTRTFLPIMGAVVGFLFGGVAGGLTVLIHPNPKKSIYFAVVTSIIFILIILAIKSQYLSTLLNEGSIWTVFYEVVYLIGFGVSFVLSVWIAAKIASSPRKDNTLK